ncbi:GGDEF domain-containing protein [Nocardia arthritidis]|uniref:Diguanylate cyclase n=1 Tax=Nocardia arthritidis TaxID=228602 RepID=A0A6G9YTL8_9NOCA|nr:GGDEF domain-containing protein [Nocardia arthritidis]QIS16558.1 diguanylate cyclase [Nocardia arthritidis]
MGDARTSVRQWWRDPADYSWQVQALASHSALGWVRLNIAVGGAVMAIITLLTLFSAYGPQGRVGHVVAGICLAFAVFWSVWWAVRPWPQETESLILFGLADLAVTANVLQDANRVYGALLAILLVAAGGYLTFFHSAKVVAAHSAWSLLTVLVLAVRMVIEGIDPRIACAIVLTMVCGVVVVLPTLQYVNWLLRTESLLDPLTTLLNRRGLEHRLTRMLGEYDNLRRSDAHRPATEISVISVDLDRFKAVNDTFGHRIGDQVLVDTARRLREAADPRAVVARVGGEEFVIVGRMTLATAAAQAERLRSAVAQSPGEVAVTASIGVAVSDGAPRQCPRATADQLLHAADAAMYQAKRCGGNLVVLDDSRIDETGRDSHPKESRPVS